ARQLQAENRQGPLRSRHQLNQRRDRGGRIQRKQRQHGAGSQDAQGGSRERSFFGRDFSPRPGGWEGTGFRAFRRAGAWHVRNPWRRTRDQTSHAVELAPDHWSLTVHFAVPYVKWGMKDPSTFILRVEKAVDIDL